MKKYCNNCGFENADKNTFCMSCGAKLSDQKNEIRESIKPIEPQPPAIHEPTMRTAEKRFVKPGKIVLTSNKNITGLAMVAIVLSIIAIIFSAFVSPAITLGSGSVDTQKLADSSVTGNKIADGTISNSDINDNGISKIADDSVNSIHIIDGAISMDDLASATVSALTGLNVIANDSITGDKIANFSIATNDLANSSVTGLKILDGTIAAADIGTDAVGSDEIAAGAVGSSEIADSSVSYSDMAIKIKYGKAPGVYNDSAGNTISYPTSFSTAPTCVVVTPYNSSGLGNAIHATVTSVGVSSFTVAIWYEPVGSSGIAIPVTSSNAVDLYWIAIY